LTKHAAVYVILLFATVSLAQEGRVEKISAKTYVAFQHNDIRIYFSEEFLKGFQETKDVDKYKRDFLQTIGSLMESGSLTGEMFLNKIGDNTSAIINMSRDDTRRFNEKGGVYESMKSFKGPIVKILYYEQKERSKKDKSQNLEYELWVTPSIVETGWGEFHTFKVVLINKPEGRAELIQFEYLGIQN
jgi:hypothetical protein